MFVYVWSIDEWRDGDRDECSVHHALLSFNCMRVIRMKRNHSLISREPLSDCMTNN